MFKISKIIMTTVLIALGFSRLEAATPVEVPQSPLHTQPVWPLH